VDPDLAETGQPYAFTGDDPLNATDPLGLSGGSQGYINYLLALNKQKKFCAAHPGIRGHSCGGLLHEIAGTIKKAGNHVSSALAPVSGPLDNALSRTNNAANNLANKIPGSTWIDKHVSTSCVENGFVTAIVTVETGGGDAVFLASKELFSLETSEKIAGGIGAMLGCANPAPPEP
jgi:hypothetical protein